MIQTGVVQDPRSQGLRQLAPTGAKLEHPVAREQPGRQRAAKPAEVAHRKVGEPQIATAMPRIRMIAGQRVEQFGLNDA
jgi:Flp pilus assembly secretin CpaC